MTLTPENLAIAYLVFCGVSFATALLFFGFFVFLPIAPRKKRVYFSFSGLSLMLALAVYFWGRIYAMEPAENYYSLNYCAQIFALLTALFFVRFLTDLLETKNKYWTVIFPLSLIVSLFFFLNPDWILNKQPVEYSLSFLGLRIPQRSNLFGPAMMFINIWVPVNMLVITGVWLKRSIKGAQKHYLFVALCLALFLVVVLLESIWKLSIEIPKFHGYSGPSLFYFTLSPFFFLMAAQNFNNVMEINRSLKNKSEELAKINQEMRFILNTISHDIVGPLVGIHGFTDLIEEQETELKEKEKNNKNLEKNYAHYVDRIRFNADHMKALLSELAEYVQIGRTDKEIIQVSLPKIIEESIDSLQTRQESHRVNLRKMIQIEGQWPETFWGAPERLQEVFYNLIDNALKYGRREDLQIKISAHTGDVGVLISIKDNGPGIPKELHKKVFDVFFRNDRGTHGTGMGLPMVRKIVEAYSGRVWIDPEYSMGTQVFIQLPFLKEEERPLLFATG